MNATAWIALLAAAGVIVQTGLKIREHLIDYPIRKEDREEDQEGE